MTNRVGELKEVDLPPVHLTSEDRSRLEAVFSRLYKLRPAAWWGMKELNAAEVEDLMRLSDRGPSPLGNTSFVEHTATSRGDDDGVTTDAGRHPACDRFGRFPIPYERYSEMNDWAWIHQAKVQGALSGNTHFSHNVLVHFWFSCLWGHHWVPKMYMFFPDCRNQMLKTAIEMDQGQQTYLQLLGSFLSQVGDHWMK